MWQKNRVEHLTLGLHIETQSNRAEAAQNAPSQSQVGSGEGATLSRLPTHLASGDPFTSHGHRDLQSAPDAELEEIPETSSWGGEVSNGHNIIMQTGQDIWDDQEASSACQMPYHYIHRRSNGESKRRNVHPPRPANSNALNVRLQEVHLQSWKLLQSLTFTNMPSTFLKDDSVIASKISCIK